MATNIKPQATGVKTAHQAKSKAGESIQSTDKYALVDKAAVGRRLEQAHLALVELRGVPPEQVKFAESLGFSRAAWNQFVKGKNLIPAEKAALLYDRFGLSLNWIYMGALGDLPMRMVEEIERAEIALAEMEDQRAIRRAKRAR